MAEYGYNEVQTVQPGAAAILEDVRPCTRCPQLVVHDNETPNLILRGIVKNPCGCNPRAQYSVSFTGDIAIPEGGTAAELQLALSVDGYIRPFTIATATPAAAEDYWHVGGDTVIDVPAGCCINVAVVNASVSDTPATIPAPALNVRNLNVKVARVS